MKVFDKSLFEGLIARAAAAPRLRMNHNIHERGDDLVQRLFNAVSMDSYIRPHRHSIQWELALVVRGKIDLLVFDDAGLVTARTSYGPHAENLGFELEPGVWHTWVSMDNGSVSFELKPGPYDPKNAAEFAPWAPVEGDAGVKEFLRKLRNAAIGDRV